MPSTLHILSAVDTESIGHVRQFFRNYADWLGRDHLPGLRRGNGIAAGCLFGTQGGFSLPSSMANRPAASACVHFRTASAR